MTANLSERATVPLRTASRPGSRSSRSAASLLAAAAGYAAAFALAYLLFVLTARGQRLENEVVDRALRDGLSTMDWARDLLAAVDAPTLVWGSILAVLLITVACRRPAAGVTALLALGGALAAAYLCKDLLARPDLDAESSAPGHNSFPSGHVSAAMAGLLAIALVLPRRVRPYLIVPGALGVAAVASATVALGWHRPSDALGGAMMVAAVCCLAAAVLAGYQGRVPAGRALTAVALGLAGPAAITVAGYLALEAVAPATAVPLAGAATMAVALLTLWQLDRVDQHPEQGEPR
ncbi:phosphatase PAP2 family protein [Amycolatopsis nigrescens]|uniref:phosphatase PAP2 family protein n=1 Tax=Amycolatopsis nigrescens TaxID=381445 RepID=UPI00037A5994|nr:phosphatase PAP2 family protein [Amycolatopsis nigrescens]